MSKGDKTYRVFLSRHYIATRFYDVRAPSARAAEGKAKRFATRKHKDVRAEATDNGWHPQREGALQIERLGGRGPDFPPNKVRRVAPGIYEHIVARSRPGKTYGRSG